jgi:hypothetical protein
VVPDLLAQSFDFLLDLLVGVGTGHDWGIIVRVGATAALSDVQNGLRFLFPALRFISEQLPDVQHHQANSNENRSNHEHQQRAKPTMLDVNSYTPG